MPAALLPNTNQTFNYDELDRLAEAEGIYGHIEYGYDAVGNRLNRTVLKADETMEETYDYAQDSHRLLGDATADIEGSNSRVFEHDANGNTVSDTSGKRLSMVVNARNRLDAYYKNDRKVAQYNYNGLGQRVSKQIVSRIKPHVHRKATKKNKKKHQAKYKRIRQGRNHPLNFLYDQSGNLIEESRQAAQPNREYIYLGNYRIAMVHKRNQQQQAMLYYIRNDHLGTPNKITDAAQTIVWSMTQTPFGEVTIDINDVEMPMRFPGQYADKESGLSYNYFRDYDPRLGRYVQSDPIGLDGGINIYGYVGGNPTNYIDPYGLEKWNWDGVGYTSVCSYYDDLVSKSGCDYYKDAAEICRGENFAVNRILELGVADAWTRDNTTASQSEISNQIRRGLISADSIYRSLTGSGSFSPRGDIIDLYHNQTFSNAGLSSFWYGGNFWPQGLYPNVVPYDPIDNFRLDPRNLLLEASDTCGCKKQSVLNVEDDRRLAQHDRVSSFSFVGNVGCN